MSCVPPLRKSDTPVVDKFYYVPANWINPGLQMQHVGSVPELAAWLKEGQS